MGDMADQIEQMMDYDLGALPPEGVPYWTTSDDEHIAISDMGNKHLLNTLKMLIRIHAKQARSIIIRQAEEAIADGIPFDNPERPFSSTSTIISAPDEAIMMAFHRKFKDLLSEAVDRNLDLMPPEEILIAPARPEEPRAQISDDAELPF